MNISLFKKKKKKKREWQPDLNVFGLSSRDTFSAGGICEQARKSRAWKSWKWTRGPQQQQQRQKELERLCVYPFSFPDFCHHYTNPNGCLKLFFRFLLFSLSETWMWAVRVLSFNLSRHFVRPVAAAHGGTSRRHISPLSLHLLTLSIPPVCVRRNGSYPSRTAVTGRPT